MPVIVSAAQLRAVLGVNNSLYNDAALDEYINAAEDAIGDFLTQWSVGVVRHKHDGVTDITTLETDMPHLFYIGQAVVFTGIHSHVNGNKTILTIPNAYQVTIETTHEETHDWEFSIPKGVAAANDLSQYAGVDAIEKAVLALAVEIFQSILTVGGTAQALDFTPSPYRLGRTLLYKVTGMISKYLDVRGMIG